MKHIEGNIYEGFMPFNPDKPNLNNRCYNDDSFSEETLIKFRENIENGRALSEYLHDDRVAERDYLNVSMKNVIGKVNDFRFESEGIYTKIELLDIDVYKPLIRDIKRWPEEIVVRPRSVGIIDPSTKHTTVEEIITFDLVPKKSDAFKNILANG